jgi:hypothetical protein
MITFAEHVQGRHEVRKAGAAGNPQRRSGGARMLGGSPTSTLPCMLVPGFLGALIDLDGIPDYVHSGWFLISDANLVVIGLMIAVFVLAIFLPFPGSKRKG